MLTCTLIVLLIIKNFGQCAYLKNYPIMENVKLGDGFASEYSDEFPEFEEQELNFLLYTRENPTAYILKLSNRELLSNSSFDPKKNTEITITGYWCTGPEFYEKYGVEEALLNREDVNVVTVDWTKYNHIPETPIPVSQYVYCPLVGKTTARFIEELIDYGAPRESIHVMGHSMGGQAVAYTGKSVKEKLERITSLDPPVNNLKLNKDDAKYVDIFRTSIFSDGIPEETGHAIFVANDGLHQPGCTDTKCNHIRALLFYRESIKYPHLFCAVKYDESEIHLAGFPSNCSANGDYYFETTNCEPFGEGC